jgi:Protein of unknown function (DUF3489)
LLFVENYGHKRLHVPRLSLQRGLGWWEQHFAVPIEGEPPVVKNSEPNTVDITDKIATKHDQVIELLQRHNGASLEEMSTLANWLPHSTRAFLTGLKKKGHDVSSDKVDGMRRYRIVTLVSQ